MLISRKGIFKIKIVDGPRGLFVDMNGNNRYIMEITLFYLVTSSASRIKPVPVPLLTATQICSHLVQAGMSPTFE